VNPHRLLPVRTHLALLVLGTLVPVMAFGVFLTLRLAEQERTAREQQLIESAQLVAQAVDREAQATVRALQILASSEHLERGDLESFRKEATRVLAAQPTWLAVIVHDREGTLLMDTLHAQGDPLPPTAEPVSLRDALAQGTPVVGNLAAAASGRFAFPVRVPVLRTGRPNYVLTAVITPEAVGKVVARDVPGEGVITRTVVDGAGVVVARTRQPEKFIGHAASPAFREVLRGPEQGVIPSVTLDGIPSYVAFSKARFSGWTAALVVSRQSEDAPLRRSLLALTAIALVLLLISGTGALLLTRRLSRGIESAAAAADSLVHGRPPAVEPEGVLELARLGDAMGHSAQLLRLRAEERDRHLARAEAALAEASSASRAKDEFLAMLGHELRNPLSPILTALELLRMRGEGRSREHQVIARQVHHMVRLVSDLMDVSRITRGQMELQRERLDMGTVVARAVEMVQPLMEQRGHRLEVELDPDIHVDGDPVRLAQVFSNLLTNAARYTPEGGHIRIHAAATSAGVAVTVQDDGTGIEPDLRARVFEPFVQGPQSLDRREGGLGIGLALVRSIVDLHDGTVTVHSEGRDRGSEFTVVLPLAEPALPALPPLPGTAPLAVSGPLRVLVVDDNVDSLQVVESVFRSAGHEVVACGDGPSALNALETFRPHVAVLDIGLPLMDGYELAERVRDRLGADAPELVALTGYGAPEDRARASTAGFRRHLVKPVTPKEILSAVAEVARVGPAAAAG
jgi:signal transduction histidine kinase/ActR/RegA family two-component response regulator